MNYMDTARRAEVGEATLPDDFIRKVVPFKRGERAQAQASFGAIVLEADRQESATPRQRELKVLIDGYEADVRQIQHLLAALREEHMLIEVGRV